MIIDNNFIRTHAYIVQRIARQYGKVRNNRQDLMQEGYIGLMEAAKRYDPTTGVQFASYASWWVRKYMREWMLNHSQIAQQLGITLMTVWRIQDAALKKMKKMLV